MLHLLKRLPALALIPVLFIMTGASPENRPDLIIIKSTGQHIMIKHSGCSWIRIGYSTTNWRCRGSYCEQTGQTTWHDVVIDTRNKAKIFYYQGAAGPASVSKVGEVIVLDSSCR